MRLLQPKKLLKSVDRITVLDGAIVAVGWCDGRNPLLVVNGSPVQDQVCSRFRRMDVAAVHGQDFEFSGFRMAAVVKDVITDNSTIGVRFEDGDIVGSSGISVEARLVKVRNSFLEQVAKRRNASLIEIGSRSRSGNSYRHLFPTIAKYVGMDISAGPNVDLVADAHTLSHRVSEQFDFAFSISVFEHLIMPWVAAYELNKVLKTGGLAYIQSHPAWPLHEEPWDFFRFSREAWSGLFNKFTGFEIVDSAYDHEASIVPRSKNNGPLQGIDTQKTFLLSACIARKIGEPLVNWSADPSEIYNIQYSH
ncbi:methyltransferase family protein [Mesorhizobium sp. J18]|uniref:methyltransferase domain-containing protein n=1 Tax=Mesorhizobium sp. J18 TaxID=935263 RepID=UPI00119C7DB8|nr:methyltransferase domain-containing protein [Mesorhizobium sp. J18]TWG93783.1 methyltransferase family protein [Mesorhizobium sp. J18]